MRKEAEMMDKIVIWLIIIGAAYGFALFIGGLLVAGLKLYDFIKSRRNHNGR
jgi:hypothetical protein